MSQCKAGHWLELALDQNSHWKQLRVVHCISIDAKHTWCKPVQCFDLGAKELFHFAVLELQVFVANAWLTGGIEADMQ